MAVYFIRAGADGPVKIGHARDPQRRLIGFRTGCPLPLRIIRSIAGGPDEERATHQHFRHLRLVGRREWFIFCDTMLLYGKSLALVEERQVEGAALTRYLKAQRGRTSGLAKALNIFPCAVTQWTQGQIPAGRVLDIERLTGVSRHELRPDVFGPAPERKAA